MDIKPTQKAYDEYRKGNWSHPDVDHELSIQLTYLVQNEYYAAPSLKIMQKLIDLGYAELSSRDTKQVTWNPKKGKYETLE